MSGFCKKTLPTLITAGFIGAFATFCIAASGDQGENYVDVPVPFELESNPIWQDAMSEFMRLKDLPDASQDIAVLRASEPSIFKPGNSYPMEAEFKKRSAPAIEFFRREFDEEYARLDRASSKIQIAPEARIRALWQDITADAATLKALVDIKLTDVRLMELIWQDVRENLLALAAFPFSERLTVLGLTADEYARTFGKVAESLDELIKIHRATERSAIENQELMYSAIAKNGIRVQMLKVGANRNVKLMSNVNIIIGGVPIPKMRFVDSVDLLAFENSVGNPDRVVAEPCKGIKIMRCGTNEWRPLAPGDRLVATDMLMVEGPVPARLTLRDTRYADLDPATVFTVWEIDYTLPPETLELIGNLIVQLASEKYTVRQAADDRLTELGHIALPYLRAAIDDPDPEIAARAADLIYRTLEIKPRKALVAIRKEPGE